MNLTPASLAMRDAFARVAPHLKATALFSALVNLLYLGPTIYMLQVYDRVVPSRGQTTLLLLSMVLLFSLATLTTLDRVRSRLLVRAGIELDSALAQPVMDATLSRPDLPESRTALRSFDNLRVVLSGTPIIALFDAPWTPIYVLVCFLVHPVIGAVALFGILILPILAWRSEKATRPRLDRARITANGSYQLQEHLIGSAGAIRALGMRDAMVRRQVRVRQSMLAEQTDANFAGGGYFTVTKFVRLALQSLALGLGAWLAIHGSISAGAIFASSFLIARALQPVEQLIGSARMLGDALGDYRSIDGLLSEVAASAAPTMLPAPKGALAVEGLTVLNARRDAMIVNAVSFAVAPGEVVAIIGPSGAGKSTLVRAIAGAMPPDRGAVRFDGAEAGNWDQERLARHIGYLPQDAVLFAGTVAENIARFSGSETNNVDAGVVAAADAVRAGDLIKHLAGGFDYRLTPGGIGLSAGQAQRIALARAMFGDPAVLILDEPNAHLDAEGDTALLEALAAAKARGASVLIVSHKLGVLPVVDKILLLRNGQAELFGPRDQVLAKIMPPQVPKVVTAGKEAAA
jgi:ATP-binding cassette subfamily C protein